MSRTSTILTAAGTVAGIGVLTMLLGAITMSVMGKPNIKENLLMFFILGAVLYLILEVTGAHRSFCINYLHA